MLTLQDPTLLRSACYINGVWTLAVKDHRAGNTGTLRRWGLRVYGH